MRAIAVLRDHRDPEIVALKIPPDMPQLMLTFGPATWSPDSRAYLMEASAIGVLRRHLARHGVRVVDERRPVDADRPQLGRPAEHDCQRLGCRGHGASRASWAARHPELDAQLAAAAARRHPADDPDGPQRPGGFP